MILVNKQVWETLKSNLPPKLESLGTIWNLGPRRRSVTLKQQKTWKFSLMLSPLLSEGHRATPWEETKGTFTIKGLQK